MILRILVRVVGAAVVLGALAASLATMSIGATWAVVVVLGLTFVAIFAPFLLH